jgi:hypothetical protein
VEWRYRRGNPLRSAPILSYPNKPLRFWLLGVDLVVLRSYRKAVFLECYRRAGRCCGFVRASRPVVFIHYPYSNPHPSQIGRVWVENNYPLKKWVGWVWGGYK